MPAEAGPPAAVGGDPVVDDALARMERAVMHDLRAGLGVVTGFGKLLSARFAPAAEPRVAHQFAWQQQAAQEMLALLEGWRSASDWWRRSRGG